MSIKINWRNTLAALAAVTTLTILPFVNPCETEESRVCTWKADTQGNRPGTNFIDYYGLTIYLP